MLGGGGAHYVMAEGGARLVNPVQVVHEEKRRIVANRPKRGLEDLDSLHAGVEPRGVEAQRHQRVAGRRKRDPALRLITSYFEAAHCAHTAAQLGEKARLPGTRVSHDEASPGPSARRCLTQQLELRQLRIAADKRADHESSLDPVPV